MKDIENRSDIDLLMVDFYRKAMADDLIGFFFHDVVQLDLEEHLPVIGDFWESVLFGGPAYRKHGRNPLQVHAAIHRRAALLPEHFTRWLQLFDESVDQFFCGPRAEFVKVRAGGVAQRMLDFVSCDSTARA